MDNFTGLARPQLVGPSNGCRRKHHGRPDYRHRDLHERLRAPERGAGGGHAGFGRGKVGGWQGRNPGRSPGRASAAAAAADGRRSSSPTRGRQHRRLRPIAEMAEWRSATGVLQPWRVRFGMFARLSRRPAAHRRTSTGDSMAATAQQMVTCLRLRVRVVRDPRRLQPSPRNRGRERAGAGFPTKRSWLTGELAGARSLAVWGHLRALRPRRLRAMVSGISVWPGHSRHGLAATGDSSFLAQVTLKSSCFRAARRVPEAGLDA